MNVILVFRPPITGQKRAGDMLKIAPGAATIGSNDAMATRATTSPEFSMPISKQIALDL